MENSIGIYGSLSPRIPDSPLDVRERVKNKTDIPAIENPFVGMIIYVENEKTYYKVTSLKSEEGSIIKKVDEYSLLMYPLAESNDINEIFNQ